MRLQESCTKAFRGRGKSVQFLFPF
uniref:Uncharacterized protein n=1 Tax=Anguilla anguilla TaxID=7936 RepID=A0A0E9Q3H7_ANGAN